MNNIHNNDNHTIDYYYYDMIYVISCQLYWKKN